MEHGAHYSKLTTSMLEKPPTNNTQQEWGFVSLLTESQLSDCVFAFCTTNAGANKNTLTAKEVLLTPQLPEHKNPITKDHGICPQGLLL